jgi:peroxiredoxin
LQACRWTVHAIDQEESVAAVPEPNKPATDFTLPNADGEPIRLSDYRGKNVVLAFYPADWSPVCTSELSLIQETLDEIHEHNAEVLGVSVDGPYSHRAWADQQNITFPLLSDFWPHGSVSREYGVFEEDDGMSGRALFFIDEGGTLRDSWVAEDPDIAPGLNIIFDALEKMNGGGDTRKHDE